MLHLTLSSTNRGIPMFGNQKAVFNREGTGVLIIVGVLTVKLSCLLVQCTPYHLFIERFSMKMMLASLNHKEDTVRVRHADEINKCPKQYKVCTTMLRSATCLHLTDNQKIMERRTMTIKRRWRLTQELTSVLLSWNSKAINRAWTRNKQLCQQHFTSTNQKRNDLLLLWRLCSSLKFWRRMSCWCATPTLFWTYIVSAD